MRREVAGKVFSTPEEAGVTPPSKEEIERVKRLAAEARERRKAVPAHKRKLLGQKFSDDLSGTEYDPKRAGRDS